MSDETWHETQKRLELLAKDGEQWQTVLNWKDSRAIGIALARLAALEAEKKDRESYISLEVTRFRKDIDTLAAENDRLEAELQQARAKAIDEAINVIRREFSVGSTDAIELLTALRSAPDPGGKE